MTTDLNLHLARLATQRAHLYGAEAAELEISDTESAAHARTLLQRAAAARRRYFREIEAAFRLGMGWSFPEAEALGRESQ